MKKIKYILILLLFHSFAEALENGPPSETYDLDALSFVEGVVPNSGISISAVLNAGETKEEILIPDVCEPEGGNPQIAHTFKKSLGHPHGGILAITCKYFLNHQGLGIKGTLYQSKIYSIEKNKLIELIPLEKKLSGYEGSSESGAYSYYPYDNEDFFSRKLNLLLREQKHDSLSLAHAITIKRLAKGDLDAIKNYLSKDLIRELTVAYPITTGRVALYNDIGFALSESGKREEALNLLLSVEKITPNRIVLHLNIADAYWPSEKSNAKKYYKKYSELMTAANKKSLIPLRVYERLNH